MSAPPVPNIADGNELFSAMMRAFHQWEAGELWSAVDAFFTGRLLSTSCTSSTSNTIGTGDKTFTVPAGLGFVSPMPIVAANTANLANNMSGFVKSYIGTTLVVTFVSSNGSGSFTAWSIGLGLSGGSASLGTNTFTGVQNFAQATDIAAAATVNLDSATGNAITITGSTGINAWTLSNGSMRYGRITGTPLLTYNATTNAMNTGGMNYQCVGGERFVVWAQAGIVYLMLIRADGLSNNTNSKIQSITATVNGVGGAPANSMLITINPTVLDFRSATLGSGSVNTRTNASPITTTISSGSTGGTINNIKATFAILLMDNAGTLEAAWTNVAGGINLDETGLISTIAEGGAGAADSASAIYSTTARSNLPYRVVGYIQFTQTTAGTYVNAPSLIQGMGGQAFTSLQSLGFSQAWQDRTGIRAKDVTYYNDTPRPRKIRVTTTNSTGGVAVRLDISRPGSPTVSLYGNAVGAGNAQTIAEIIPPGCGYLLSASSGTLTVIANGWMELDNV